MDVGRSVGQSLPSDSAGSLRARLTAGNDARFVNAMSNADRLRAVATAVIEPVDPESTEAQWCVAQYFAELAVLFEGGFDASQALPVDPRDLMPPRGVCLVARASGNPIGTGSLKPLEPGVAYIKRMWVAQDARGAGLGKRILTSLEEWAVELGYERVRLETNRALEGAIAMYRKYGYREIERFNDEPYGDYWFEKSLT